MQQTDKNSILFFDVSKVEYLPLIRSVAESGFLPILNDTPLRRKVANAGLPLQKWEFFKPPHTPGLVQKEIIRIAEGLANLLKRNDVQKGFASPLGNFLPVTGELFVEQFMNLVAGEIATIETLHALSQSENLKLIVLGCDNSSTERALLLYAEKLGIPTLQLAHGIQGKATQAGVVTRSRSASLHKLYSNFAAVFGQQMQDDLVEAGIEPERIFVTGCPFWDPLYLPESRIDAVEARTRLGLNKERPVILICSSYADGSSPFFAWNSKKLFHHHKLVLEAIKQTVPQAQVILRPHPHELLRATDSPKFARAVDDLYNRWLKERGFQHVRIIRDQKVEAIRAADVIVTLGTSSLIAEAMILKRPVVMLPWIKYDYHFVGKKDGVLMVEDESRLLKIFSDLFSRPEFRKDLIKRQQKALSMINHKNDGRATERVADLIIDLATKSEIPSNRENASSPRLPTSPGDLQTGESERSFKISNDKSGKFNILQIVHDFPPSSFSGTELYTLNLSKELQKLGHEVVVLYPVVLKDREPYSFENRVYEGLKIVQFNVYHPVEQVRSDFLNPQYDGFFEQYLNSHDFDLIHFQHIYGLSASWVSVAKKSGLPVFLKIDDMFFFCRQLHLLQNNETHCSGPESIDKCFECVFASKKASPPREIAEGYRYLAFRRSYLQEVFRNIDFVHSPCQYLKSACFENGFENDEFRVIPTGIKPFRVLKKKVKENAVIRLAFLGNIDARKGIQDFLTAIELYQKEWIEKKSKTDLEFVIYGHHSNNDSYQDMLARIKNLKNVEYKGGFSPRDRTRIFSEIDLLVMPSIGENYPFILREALFASVPVVATAIAGVPEIIKDKRNGFLYPPGDVEALASIFSEVSKDFQVVQQLKPDAQIIKTVDQEAAELEKEYSHFIMQNKQVTFVSTLPALEQKCM